MPKRKTTKDMQQDHSPDFKSKVVLEYIRNPRRLKLICKENQISEELLIKWHQEFLERASQVFSDSMSPAPQVELPSPKIDVASKSSIENTAHEVGPLWGIRLNRDRVESHQTASSEKVPPKWLRASDRGDWKSKRGVVIWDNHTQRIEVLSASHSLNLLETLRQTDRWQTEGIPITRHVTRLYLTGESQPKSLRNKKSQDKLDAIEAKPNYEEVEEEQMRLNAQAGAEIIDFLQQHEALLKQMIQEDEKSRVELLARVYSNILSWDDKEE